MATERVQLTIGIVRRGDDILLVRERLGGDCALLWSLPGGGVEAGELLPEALRRELWEETGLEIGMPTKTAFIVHADSDEFPSAIAMAFEIDTWSGQPMPHDDDIESVAFFPLDEALVALKRLESDVQREPIVEYLSGRAPAGTTWIYRSEGDVDSLLARW